VQNSRNVVIECSEEVKDYLGQAGYNPAYGARPLGRIIEREVLNKLAVLILRGSIQDGEVARVIMRDGRIDVVPNHEVQIDEDLDMTDEDDFDAMAEMEDNSGDMDLYD
jgi:ATP-dependent Clp protease ATP-binding subunit ClpA